MRGCYNRLQQLIHEKNSQAIYIWCFSHYLNLVVSDVVSAGTNAMDLFRNLERLYDFVSSSKYRAELFEKKQKELYPNQQIHRLKRVTHVGCPTKLHWMYC